MLIPSEDIKTKEVLKWQGLHLLHYPMSSCSQKVRILLGEKQIDWTSHPIDLRKKEQKSDWFIGINKNAVVPVLIHDGKVYNESNDILRYLDETFPSDRSWFPETADEIQRAEELLTLEHDLHIDLRSVTFKYMMPGKLMGEDISEEQANAAVRQFDTVFRKLEAMLEETPYLCGDRITLPDIAWFINLHRLALSGYPLARLPKLANYYETLKSRPAFKQEISAGPKVAHLIGSVFRSLNRLKGTTPIKALEQVA